MVNTQNKASTMTATKEIVKGTVVVEGHSFPRLKLTPTQPDSLMNS